MKKPMEQLKEIMGVEEQSAAKNMSKELSEVKRQIKNLLTVTKIIMVIAIMFFVIIIIGGISLVLDYGKSPSIETAEEIYTFVQFAVTAAAVWYISAVCKGFCNEIDKCDTPFIPQVPKGLKKIATAIVIMLFVLMVAESAYSLITDTEFTPVINMAWWVSVLMLMLLSSIFDYGCKLQKESDETL